MKVLASQDGPAINIDSLAQQIVEESRLLLQRIPSSPNRSRKLAQFDLEFLLSQGAEAALDRLSEPLSDRLRRKIEVARKVYQTYEPDLSRPTSSVPLSAEAINQLCALMLLAALRQRDVRFLNSALKLIDGILAPANVQVSQRLISLAHATLQLLLPTERRT